MIEKIMKAVKSGSKKRGRNITIGAVVGMLLSCTTAMGGDNYLWIKDDSGTIKFSTNNFDPTGVDNPYGENIWKGSAYINYMTLLGTDNNSSSSAYGVKLSGTLEEFKFINNGSIAGIAENTNIGSGIYNTGTIKELVNNGVIIGEATDSRNTTHGDGINNGQQTIIKLVNDGSIRGTGTETMGTDPGMGYGIFNIDGNIGELINNGSIIGIGTSRGGGHGIETGGRSDGIIYELVNNGSITGTGTGTGETSGIETGGKTGEVRELLNNGSIVGMGTGDSYGISDMGGRFLANKGVIYGKNSAIAGYITGKNYGLLINETNATIGGGVALENNYGLIFKAAGGKYTAKDAADYEKFGQTFNDEFIIGYEKQGNGDLDKGKPIKEKFTIINAKAKGAKENITGTESLSLDNGILTDGKSKEINISSDGKYVLNGITDTLKVTGQHNNLNNSIINAYETAVIMNESESILTLNNTVVNGGISEGNTVKITGNGNNFTVKGDSVINTKDGTTAIEVTGNNNAVVLSGNVIVNGKIEATGTGHFLNLNGTSENGMNMLYDISGFKNMNIDNNVTFFENIKVTGTDTVTVEETGILTLRLQKDDNKQTTIPEAIHAFSENEGGVLIKGDSPSEAGTLNFVTNGIGKEIIVRNITLENMEIKTSSIIDSAKIYDEYIHLGAGSDLNGIVNPKEVKRYNQLNKIYRSIYSSADADNNLDTLRDILNLPTYLGKNYDYNNRTSEEQLANLLWYLGSVYTETPYSFSSELSRKSTGMFRDIVTENHFRPDLNKWMIMGGLTHADGGTKDTYYGQNYHGFDGGTADTDVDMKLTGAYALGKYGYSENVSLGVTVGGNKSEVELSMSKVEGSSGYIGAFVENYRGNLTLKAGGGIQYSEYDADRGTLGGHSYNEKYSDMAYDIYLNGRYSHNIGDNLFLEPYGTLSYTYIDQDGADEGDKALAIETDSKSFDYTVGKAGIDLKKVIPHEKGKSTLSAGVSYTKILDGADEEVITGRFKGGRDFDILVAHKNEHSIGVNAKYALELENGVLFDVKGTYIVERDSHNNSGKNRTKGEWIVGTGLGYRF